MGTGTIVNNNGHKENSDTKISNNEYWEGPYGILVPAYITSVLAEDGYNTLYDNGGQTEIGSTHNNMTETQYKKKYAVYSAANQKWYYYKPCYVKPSPNV